ncbi:glycoside hydrolase superfamily [Leucosporidium creatinivorum]|uniref:glucan endo-1,6-beta-glucosidase n=1 Tax=Leucosporidium creatinivorum TaxID=106004 RepID=A0A1Y2EVL8_9BASI|nr:glycoside hydrolase superfamily [Leucosporidium creatinivorum]
MMHTEWERMGCGSAKSEFDCMLGNSSAQAGFTWHWEDWITQEDFTKMKALGINTVRIPLGYWIVEDTVDQASEHFPKGGFPYLRRASKWAAEAGLSVILVLHGAPGAQAAEQPFTGQLAPTAGFYETYNYERAYKWFTNITTEVHTDTDSFSSTFSIEAVNEPISGQSSMISDALHLHVDPGVLNAVRTAEEALGISCSRLTPSFAACLQNWGSGEPTASLPNQNSVVFDSHIYLKYRTPIATTRSGYLSEACGGLTTEDDSPVIVGEFSLSPDGDNEHKELSTEADDAAAFYLQFFSAQVAGYEKQAGWVFWSWKTSGLNDPRWDYQLAVEAGYIPSDASAWSKDACDGV